MNESLTIGWLYPDLMSIYGDRGNITCLQKRCVWRDITVVVKPITLESKAAELRSLDLLFMGGAQDRQQTIVFQDLRKKKEVLRDLIEKGIPGLYICGGYQFLGKYYKEADGSLVEGLHIFDLYTINPGEHAKRLIGNMSFTAPIISATTRFVGFENHGGRTYLGKNIKPFGKIIMGFGNNGEDGYEGAIYKNSIGSYSHGPILPKNPEIADWLILKALAIKYKIAHNLQRLDDILAEKARMYLLQKPRLS